jgi:hypothetical protein
MIMIALVSAALAALPAPAAPSASAPASVRVRIAEADYVRKVAPGGSIILTGRGNDDGVPFRFTVRDGVVRGWVGNRWVKFPLAEATRTLH